MMDLTFAEQVKIILSRRGMTIKELAELIEASTGKKMSRQNLTQRLGRDNFQEQDMRMIAGILGCPFYLNILDESISAETEENHLKEQENIIEEVVNTLPEEAVEEQLEQEVFAVEEIPEEYEQEIMEELPEEYEQETVEEIPEVYEEEMVEEIPAEPEESVEEILEEVAALERENQERENSAQGKKQDNRTVFEDGENKGKKHSWTSYLRRRKKHTEEPKEEKIETPVQEENKMDQPEEPVENIEQAFDTETIYLDEEDEAKEVNAFTEYAEEQVKQLEPEGLEEEDLEKGDVNPYTGHEYQSNSVRMHPSRIGYVQVYDRGEHKWTDMTEWAFLGYQERKKVLLGKDYEPPIYLD